jgi:hypothetical protein
MSMSVKMNNMVANISVLISLDPMTVGVKMVLTEWARHA